MPKTLYRVEYTKEKKRPEEIWGEIRQIVV